MSKYKNLNKLGEHTHPITIFFNLWRVFYLIIVPILRGFILALRGNFGAWVSGAWIDIMVLAFMVALATFRWYYTTYSWNDDHIVFHSSFITLRHTVIKWKKVSAISIVDPFYLKPFSAVFLRVDTLGGSFKDSDLSLHLSREKARDLLSHHQGGINLPPDHHYSPGTSSVLALAILSSNSFAGILYLAAFISQSGKLLGDEFSDMLIGTFEETTRSLAFDIPPAAAAIGYMLLIGWFTGFVLILIRYKNFRATRGISALNIQGGIFTNRDFSINYSHINFIDIRQTIATKMLGLYSLYISASGYGKHKDDISCVILAEKKESFTNDRHELFPAFTPIGRMISPEPRGFFRFISDPMVFCICVPATAIWCIRTFPDWSSFILFVGLMSLIPSIFFLVVRIIDFKTGGVGWCDDKYTLRYSAKFNIHTVILSKEKIVKIALRQSLFQRFGPYCDLLIYTVAEKRVCHKCRSLNRADLVKVFFPE